MRLGIIANPQKPLKPLILACPEGIDVLKLFGVFFNLHTLFIQEANALARSCIYAGSSEPSSHANVTRTIISCAD